MKSVNGGFYQRHWTLLLRSVFAVRIFFQIEPCPCSFSILFRLTHRWLILHAIMHAFLRNLCIHNSLATKLSCVPSNIKNTLFKFRGIILNPGGRSLYLPRKMISVLGNYINTSFRVLARFLNFDWLKDRIFLISISFHPLIFREYVKTFMD